MKKIFTVLLLVVVVIIGVLIFTTCENEKFVWTDMVLSEMLPEPPTNKGKIYTNSNEELDMAVYEVSEKQYNDYIESCKEKGFNIDVKNDALSYEMYNSEGYKLTFRHYSEEMHIELIKPMEMEKINWPEGVAGKLLPMPKSLNGNFSYENEKGFMVYIGNTSKDECAEYIEACKNNGFTLDYSKGDFYYYAKNSEGWLVHICYEGNNTMSIKMSAPSEDSTTPSTDKSPDKDNSATDVLDPDFKAAMDSYEKFMDEYVAFVKKYNANPSDMELIKGYADYMKKYTTFVADFQEWGNKEMNTAEAIYYAEVQARVSKKLLEVTN